MKIKKDFLLREVPGMNVVMPTGENVRTFDGAVILNETAVVIYKELEKGADREALISALQKEYAVDAATAGADVDMTLDSFRQAGILED